MGIARRGIGETRAWRESLAVTPTEAAVTALVAVTVALGYVLPRHGVKLGAPTPPFYAFPHVRITWWTPLAAAGTIGLAAAAPRLLRLPARWCVAGATATALAARVLLNVSRYGPHELVRPLVGPIGSHDFLPTVPQFLASPGGYLRDFSHNVLHGLPIHPSAHPPGTTILLAGLDRAGAGGAWGDAAFILLAGAAATPLVYLLGRSLAGEREARIAMLAWAFAPTVLLESATSTDAVFATAGLAAAVLAVRRRRAAAAVAATACSFLSWALPAATVWAVGVLWLRGRRRDALVIALLSAVAAAVFYFLLWQATGFDPVATYRATKFHYEHGISHFRPYWYWLAGDPAAFLAGLGVPVALAYARALNARTAPALALAAVLLVAAASGYSKAEVERIWQFFVPLAVVAAAPQLARLPVRAVLVALAVQAVAVEVLFGTTW
jgi:methylthioxylose transferase